MDIEEKLKQIKSRFEEVNAAMSDPSVFDDPDKYTELTKERSDLEELVQDYDSWKIFGHSINIQNKLVRLLPNN